jgi:tetratricopeptide (TPR) repeat protein
MERAAPPELDPPQAAASAAISMPSSVDPAPTAIRPARFSRRVQMTALLVFAASCCAATIWFTARRGTDPDRIWADAERAFLAGRWDEAQDALGRLGRLRPRQPLDRMLEAQLATAHGRFGEAIAAIGQIPDDHAIAPQAHLLAGRIERQRRHLPMAEAEFRRALALKPGLIEAHNELIYILGIQSRRREVDAEFRALARLKPLNHHDLFTWALTHFTHWNPDIVSDLDGFITADPGDRHSRLAVAELVLDRPDTESYITRVLAPLPNTDPDALAIRINLAFNLGRIDEAATLLDHAPAGHPRIERIRGEIGLRRRDLDAAVSHFRAALSAEPYDRVSPMQLAQALRLKGDLAGAEIYLDRIQRLNRVYNLIIRVKSPKNANELTDLAELGKAFEAADLLDEARGWYTLAISMDPLDSEAQRALRRLRARHDG